jgi:hypothetical protein
LNYKNKFLKASNLPHHESLSAGTTLEGNADSLLSEDYLPEDKQGLSIGEMLMVNFRQPRVLVMHWFRL